MLQCLFEQQAIHNQNVFRSQKQNYKINLISNLAAGGIYAMKIICILRPVTRGRRIVAAKSYWQLWLCYLRMEKQMQRNVLEFWFLLHEDEGTDSAKLTGILVPVTRGLRNRHNESCWHFGSFT